MRRVGVIARRHLGVGLIHRDGSRDQISLCRGHRQGPELQRQQLADQQPAHDGDAEWSANFGAAAETHRQNHLRFAQSRTLGRKVSDEFTVSLCRGHNREVHHYGDEAMRWKAASVDPAAAARALWRETHPLPHGQDCEGIDRSTSRPPERS